MNNIDALYSEHILNLANNLVTTRESEISDDKYVIVKYNNPSCGDVINLYVKSDGNIIEDIKVNIDGCVISKASTHLLIDSIKGKSLEELSHLMPYDMHNMLGVNVGEMRAPCVLTPYFALRKYLEELHVTN